MFIETVFNLGKDTKNPSRYTSTFSLLLLIDKILNILKIDLILVT